MFGGAQVVAGTRSEGGLATSFGLWPLASVQGALPAGPMLDLLVHADALELVVTDEGLAVRDCHQQGRGVRVVLIAPDRSEITVETQGPVDPARRYRVIPRPGSVKAFART
jgi:iron(III) transport system ATP-binding protein